MQGRRCAYCEGSLEILGKHIEHFRRKHQFHFPELTFAWNNLYWSCNQSDSCGHYKDSGAAKPYNINELIDPCTDNPDDFFRFRSDGTISIRRGLSATDEIKAKETLRVFNLHPNGGRLRNMRMAALACYVSLVDDASGFAQEELRDLFEDELAVAGNLPFSTAIRHVLTEP
jgi:uncharacterized protein (TIGR02646 family)